ncbi:MAG TPA: DNA-binding response regulator [Rhodocyclaceae bacterium]|nr:MAG: DNA-binding response regulator [Betaproteobacteria bacterium CG2_30_68_42]PJA58172.1 MAG: DNA-binding response regulator [Rhodocyclales bacterium CG_4_9_14_3_um_filter_68_10]HCX34691.1 DNA-binding response regulator [Rhodocyclaceae bacterium]
MIRILIVDDHAILRAGLKHLLSEAADIVVGGEAGNGVDALALAREGHWDAIVLDMSMPGKSGIELIRQLKAEHPRLPVLVLSMYAEDIYAVRALRAGASGYLCKDNAEAQLEPAIRKVASGGRYITPAVAEKLALAMLGATGRGGDAPPHTRLSDREYQVFRDLAVGLGVTEIGRRLNLSVKTISTHKARLMEKMGFANAAELIQYALRHGLVDRDESL